MAAAQPRAIALRLYRQLQCARRQFPADPTRAEGGADLPCVLQARIRQAFEESRNVKEQPQLDKLMEHGQAELHALHTISSHAFAQQYPTSAHAKAAAAPAGSDRAASSKPGSVRFSIFGKFWNSN